MPTSATGSLTVSLASKEQGAYAIAQAVSGRPVTVFRRPVFRPKFVHVVVLLSTNWQCGLLCSECVGVPVTLPLDTR